jgi:hypothetical protein
MGIPTSKEISVLEMEARPPAKLAELMLLQQ